ncbi:MAG: adenylate/guanylate cyclase domain-containing protein [Deltaproteobacteria bacterium]|nr:adenylate/guanylate cyclase domain-containing protein [Deltaproteobacteria bacterium]
MTRFRHPAVGAGLLALLLAGLSAATRTDTGHGGVELLERWTLDWRFRARGPAPPSPEIALVVFDDATAERSGPLFERRAGWATVIRALKAAGAKVIGVDAVFDAPEHLVSEDVRARVLAWAAAHPAPAAGDEAALLLSVVARELDGDGELEAAIRDAGNVVLILFAGEGARPAEADASLARARYAQSTPGERNTSRVESLNASLPRFNAAAKGLGFATVSEDATRTVRRFGLMREHQGAMYLPFPLPAVAAFRDVNRGRLAWLGPQQQVRLGAQTLELDADALWLDYRGPQGTFPTYPVLDLVQGRVPAGALAGKLVLIGVTRLGYDAVRTPFQVMPGVEVQATAIDNVLRGAPLRRSSRTVDLFVTLGVALLASLLFVSRGLRPAVQVAGTVALVTAWVAAAHLAFVRASLWLPLVAPVAAALACGVAGLALSYASEALQRRELKKAFGHYLGAEVLEELLARPDMLALGGERRRLTVLFSDIRDFTTLSEKLPPEKLVAFLNTYLSPMTRAVLRQGGLLDKYIGDAVMGVFGAPVVRADHATLALACVLEMHAELEALNKGPLAALGLDVAIGVGLNTGDMVVGNLGSAERFDYTVAGDAVNLASRLEGLTKTYGVFCLVGAGTREAASADFAFRDVDLVQVKGKHEPVAVSELLGGPGRAVAAYEGLDAWQRGIAAWRAGRLGEARAVFTAFATSNPADAVARRYLERLATLPDVAPEGFSPVAAFTTK